MLVTFSFPPPPPPPPPPRSLDITLSLSADRRPVTEPFTAFVAAFVTAFLTMVFAEPPSWFPVRAVTRPDPPFSPYSSSRSASEPSLPTTDDAANPAVAPARFFRSPARRSLTPSPGGPSVGSLSAVSLIRPVTFSFVFTDLTSLPCGPVNDGTARRRRRCSRPRQ